MVVASFFSKDLRIHWQDGEHYFMQQLFDADIAANNGNRQWCASTGTDPMRGYRLFNPTLRSQRFDPEGEYVRQYIPELALVPAKLVHAPHLMNISQQEHSRCRIGHEYPAPIVDHQRARKEYLDFGKPAPTSKSEQLT